MRLRYLHLQNYPPISNIKVCFASGSPLARECAIRFVVGVNGSGKSNLLRAVAEVFLALADLRVPAFPVSLVYELGVRGSPSHRTLLLHCPGDRQAASLWLHERFAFDDQSGQEVFESCIEHLVFSGMPIVPGFTALIEPGHWPQRDSTPPQIALPSAVLAYTTGDLRPWRSVWARNQNAEGLERIGEGDEIEERPAGWTAAQEQALHAAGPDFRRTLDVDSGASTVEADSFRRPLLLDATLLKCAVLAVTLSQAFAEKTGDFHQVEADTARDQQHRRSSSKNALKELLERGGWHHLVSAAFRSRLHPSQWGQQLRKTAHDWWLCSSEVISEPHPTDARRILWFDMNAAFDTQTQIFVSSVRDEIQACETHGEALWALLGGAKDASAFDLFICLLELNQAGLFDDLLLRLRRHPASDAADDKAQRDLGVLRYEELSDGEQMFIGRMALFHLLRGRQDALLLLDEPETHFNDLWKRDVVSVVEDALEETSVDVLIATHAALMLTDALKEELVVLDRVTSEERSTSGEIGVRVLDPSARTFGATGDHPLRDVFGAPDTVGRRASRLLEVLIATVRFGSEAEGHWKDGSAFSDDLIERILKVAQLTESGLTHSHVANYVVSFERFATHFGVERPLSVKSLLEAFIKQTGPGYFQVELKRAWRRSAEGALHAS